MYNRDDLTGAPGAGDCKISAEIKPDTEPFADAYRLSPEQAAFFKGETKIDSDDDLKTHILELQEKAYEIFPYICIRQFTFLRTGISERLEYENIIKLGKERPDEILLDAGCCFGVDARKAISDGFPLENVVTTDLNKDFFSLGHELFRTTPETYPLCFVPGDVFDPKMLQIVPPFDKPPSTEKPDLSTLTSLNPLAGRCAVIHASNFFHLFSEENQFRLAKAFAGLLSPLPGSIISGEHAGAHEKQLYQGEHAGRMFEMFQHSPESWKAMWHEVFGEGKVKVNVVLERVLVGPGLSGFDYDRLLWSVVRL